MIIDVSVIRSIRQRFMPSHT